MPKTSLTITALCRFICFSGIVNQNRSIPMSRYGSVSWLCNSLAKVVWPALETPLRKITLPFSIENSYAPKREIRADLRRSRGPHLLVCRSNNLVVDHNSILGLDCTRGSRKLSNGEITVANLEITLSCEPMFSKYHIGRHFHRPHYPM